MDNSPKTELDLELIKSRSKKYAKIKIIIAILIILGIATFWNTLHVWVRVFQWSGLPIFPAVQIMVSSIFAVILSSSFL